MPDSTMNEQEGAGEPRILRAVSHGTTTFLPGHEKHLTAAVLRGELAAEHLTRLTQTSPPALSGDWAALAPAKEPEKAEPDALPSIRKLEAALADMSDVAVINAMREKDDRKSADPLYAARLAELGE